MSELIEKLRNEFQDQEYRHSYAEECLNTMIATQIKVLREQRGMTQERLADETGMRQPRIPLLEDSNYSNWTINTLKRFAKAFDVALSVKFETFSKLIHDFENLGRESLQRPRFANDPVFQFRRPTAIHRLRRRRSLESQRRALQANLFRERGQLIEWPETTPAELNAARKVLAATEQGGAHAIGVCSAG
ncbi:MAG: helix-turn-helix transcriptional regulator [Terriglobales bacterium]|jgi:transcriptional regulator with XRE-family HTH domain